MELKNQHPFVWKIDKKNPKEPCFSGFTQKDAIDNQNDFMYCAGVVHDANPRFVLAFDPVEFRNSYDGCFVVVHVNKDVCTTRFFTDLLGKKEVYYGETDKEIIIGSDLSFFDTEHAMLDTDVIATSLLLYPPKRHTLFKGVKRLGFNEMLVIKNDILFVEPVEKNFMPILVKKESEVSLDEYQELMESAILKRVDWSGRNVVMLSGGWDSTFILAVLRNHVPSDKLAAVTFEMVLPDGRSYNRFEIDKVRKIAEFFDVELHIVPVDLSNDSLVGFWNNYMKDSLHDNMLLGEIMINQFMLAEYVKKFFGDDVRVFNGEGCDSLHHFGFSQYITTMHDDYRFRMYADKMMNYLYSPHFFKKLVSGDDFSDVVYDVVSRVFGKNILRLSINMDFPLFNYLFNFVFRLDAEFTDGLSSDSLLFLHREYFKEVIDNIDSDALYYWLLRLYLDFHLQGYSIRKLRASLPNTVFPFLDKDVFRFCCGMPVEWGRGLDFYPTKYPLKVLCKRYRFPYDLIASDGHSYLMEVSDVCYRDELLCRSSLSSVLNLDCPMQRHCDVLDYNLKCLLSHGKWSDMQRNLILDVYKELID